jgi:hypothetical protein
MHIFALGRYHKVSRCQVVRDPGHFGVLSGRLLLHRVVPYRIVPYLPSAPYLTIPYHTVLTHSVPDPSQFGTDPVADPDPRIRTSE